MTTKKGVLKNYFMKVKKENFRISETINKLFYDFNNKWEKIHYFMIK